MAPQELTARIKQRGIIAVLTLDDPKLAVPLARTLAAAGVDIMELTLRTPAALEALKAVVKEVPEMLAGAGTVLTPKQVSEVKAAGAAFAVAPGCNPRILEAAKKEGLFFAPGVATPSDIEQALEHDCRVLKFFPAEPSGGVAYLKNMAAPYAHLGVSFIPLGGLSATNIGAYFKDPLTLAVGGSWIAPRDKIAAKDWATIGATAKEALAKIAEARAAK